MKQHQTANLMIDRIKTTVVVKINVSINEKKNSVDLATYADPIFTIQL